MSGLQRWAQAELRRQGVKDLLSAMAAVDCLIDYKMDSNSSVQRKNTEKKACTSKGWKKEDEKKKFEGPKSKDGDQCQKSKSFSGCFIRNGLDRAKDCPKREKLNALRLEGSDDSSDEAPTRVNPLQLVNAITTLQRGLMYVQVTIDGTEVLGMMDTGATNNFISSRIVEKMGLIMTQVASVLEEFVDVMPPELPRTLPPRRAIDYKIELEPGARAPAQAPYRMAQSKLAELRRQLDDLLDARFIQPSKAP
ncbi:unnamed protein product [Fraxinus pennsylvanica]|uniref:Gag-pol polyprotein n=1 Tax=Fraxinus pennsylvanica TaxID=56036 RepID=A0AAD1YRD2_9LAMI|nr:unnamed protein product [Fraxinus pennsylvanica]